MAKGKYDAYLLMPRGVRDEEFHNAITDLLSDWGSTVPDPEVVAVKIISPAARRRSPSAIRDFLDRMGMPSRVYPPDSDGRPLRARPAGTASRRTRWSAAPTARSSTPPASATSRSRMYGAPTEIDLDHVVDVAVVGGGPAGLAAAVYAASEGLSDGHPRGRGDRRPGRHQLDDPQLPRLPARHLRHAAGAARPQPGAALRRPVLHRPGRRRAAARASSGDPHVLCTDRGEVRARSVVIASGVAYRKLRVEPLEALVGIGVYYGAAMTAAREMEDQDVFVVGGGNSAGQAAVHLARFARSVTIVVRRPDLAETMSQYLIGEIEYNPRISVRTCTTVVDGGGDGRLEWLGLEDVRTGEREQVPAYGLFLLLGAEPRCDWLPTEVVPRRARLRAHRPRRPRASAGSTACRRRTSRPRCPASSPPATSAPAR